MTLNSKQKDLNCLAPPYQSHVSSSHGCSGADTELHPEQLSHTYLQIIDSLQPG